MDDKIDRLEEFVKHNRESFDVFEPPMGMFDKIQREVAGQSKPKGKSRTLTYVRRIAAAVVILLAGYGIVHLVLDIKPEGRKVAETIETISPENQELGEAVLYYASKINNEREQLEKHAANHPEILEDIKQEFEDLDSEYQSLEDDLQDGISNQTVIEAMIRTAKIKLAILEEMNREMKRIEEKNNERHENTTNL